MNSTQQYEVFIGLEIHIHLKTESKMFCSCKAQYGNEPNTNICPVCLGYPGTLPQLNKKALELAYLVAHALGCTLSQKTVFARKNYFYPDMPKNYQISQFDHPVGINGVVKADLGAGVQRDIRIHDVHLEEDAGKMIHSGDVSLLDFNRAGYPLLEIVTEPDLRSGEETEIFLKGFQRLIRYLAVSDGNMDEGSMKCDANISVNTKGSGLGTKVELKNMNSPRFVRLALNHEAERQIKMVQDGGSIVQETRLWNENRDRTETMRRKEASDDYRYFPEPDLPPFCPDKAFLKRMKASMVEFPLERKKRLKEEYSLTEEQAEFIHDDLFTAELFEEAVRLGASARQAASWLSSDVRKILNRENIPLQGSALSAKRLHGLLELIDNGRISGKIAKQVLEKIFSDNLDPNVIVDSQGWAQITDTGQISNVVQRVFQENPQIVQAIRAGDAKQKGWLMGQIMKLSEGRAAPQVANRILEEQLQEK